MSDSESSVASAAPPAEREETAPNAIEQGRDDGSIEERARALLADGNEAAARDELARGYRSRVVQYCRRVLGDARRAEAACDQVLRDAARELGRADPTPALHDWLRRLADRRCAESIDEQILAQLARGDKKGAGTMLCDAYAVRILGVCRQLLRDPVAAEDAAQEAVLQACRDLDRFQRRGSLYGWLRGIARNRCVDAARKRARLQARMKSDDAASLEYVDAGDVAPDELLDRRRLYRAVVECVRHLSPKNRDTVVARFVSGDDVSYEELSVLMEEHDKGATLSRRVNRSMADLRECLKGKGYG